MKLDFVISQIRFRDIKKPGRIHGIVNLICDIKIVFVISHNDILKSHIQILDYVLVSKI